MQHFVASAFHVCTLREIASSAALRNQAALREVALAPKAVPRFAFGLAVRYEVLPKNPIDNIYHPHQAPVRRADDRAGQRNPRDHQSLGADARHVRPEPERVGRVDHGGHAQGQPTLRRRHGRTRLSRRIPLPGFVAEALRLAEMPSILRGPVFGDRKGTTDDREPTPSAQLLCRKRMASTPARRPLFALRTSADRRAPRRDVREERSGVAACCRSYSSPTRSSSSSMACRPWLTKQRARPSFRPPSKARAPGPGPHRLAARPAYWLQHPRQRPRPHGITSRPLGSQPVDDAERLHRARAEAALQRGVTRRPQRRPPARS